MNVALKIDRIKHPKKYRKTRRKYDPNFAETQRVLEIVTKESPEDWFVLYFLSVGDDEKGLGLRVGEVIGDHRHGANLPGLQVEDVRDNGIWVRGKMGHENLMEVDPDIIRRLRAVCIGSRTRGMVFKRYEGLKEAPNILQKKVKKWARQAGIIEWKYVTPHRFRAGFSKHWRWVRHADPGLVQAKMRHLNPATQLIYTGQMPDEERRRQTEELLKE